MSRSSGGSIASAMQELRSRHRQNILNDDPLYQKASGNKSKTQQQTTSTGRKGRRIMQRQGILQQGLNHA